MNFKSNKMRIGFLSCLCFAVFASLWYSNEGDASRRRKERQQQQQQQVVQQARTQVIQAAGNFIIERLVNVINAVDTQAGNTAYGTIIWNAAFVGRGHGAPAHPGGAAGALTVANFIGQNLTELEVIAAFNAVGDQQKNSLPPVAVNTTLRNIAQRAGIAAGAGNYGINIAPGGQTLVQAQNIIRNHLGAANINIAALKAPIRLRDNSAATELKFQNIANIGDLLTKMRGAIVNIVHFIDSNNGFKMNQANANSLPRLKQALEGTMNGQTLNIADFNLRNFAAGPGYTSPNPGIANGLFQ